MKKIFWWGMLACLIIGTYIRSVNIESNPPHLGNDEISIAYDSYSVRTIGKDEHGHSWPLSFESHRTYKAPLYAYFNMPFNAIWGNTEAGVRYLSVVSSLVAIIVIGLIGREIVGDWVGLAVAVLLTLDPKNISVSRIAFEANLASTMMLIGIYLIIRFRKSLENKWLVGAGIFLGLSIWGYHTQWGLTPLLAMIWPWLSHHEINIKKWWKMWLVMVLVAMPIFVNFVRVAIYDPYNRASSQLWTKDVGIELLWKNEKVNIVKKVIITTMAPVSNYIEHFGLNTNFSSGLLFGDRQPLDSGWHLLITLPLILIGLFSLNKYLGKWKDWLWSWWLLCPVIPALTTGGVSSVRNLAFIMPTLLIGGIGLVEVFKKSRKWGILTIVVLAFNFAIFSRGYFVHFQKYAGDNFQYGYKQAWEYVKPSMNKYEHIIVEPKFGISGQFVGVPHLYYGYFGAFTAEEMQKRIDKNGTMVGKFEFRTVDWNNEVLKHNSIYVVSVINPMAGKAFGKLDLLNVIQKPDHQDQFLIYKTL